MKKLRILLHTLLQKSGTYLKADMLYITKGSFWVVLGQSINSVLSLFLIIAFANLLPKETYGIYRYILSVAGILNICTLTGMNGAVARTVALGNEGILQPAVRYQIKWNSLMTLAFLGLSGYYYLHNDSTFALSFLLLGACMPLTLSFNTYGAYLEGKKEFKMANIFGVLSTLLYSLGTLAIIYITENVVLMILVYAITTFLSSFIFYVYTLRRFKPKPSLEISATLTYGRELTYLRFIDPILSQIDKIILVHFWGPAQLATYTLAQAIPNRAMLFVKSWVAIGFPKFAEKTPKMINVVFYRRIVQGMAFGCILTLFYFFLSPYLFKYLLPQYMDGLFYSQLLALNLIFALPIRYMSLLFTSQGLSKLLFKRAVTIGIISILLYLFFGIWGGIFGLVIANILIAVISLLLNIALWRKVSKHTEP